MRILLFGLTCFWEQMLAKPTFLGKLPVNAQYEGKASSDTGAHVSMQTPQLMVDTRVAHSMMKWSFHASQRQLLRYSSQFFMATASKPSSSRSSRRMIPLISIWSETMMPE